MLNSHTCIAASFFSFFAKLKTSDSHRTRQTFCNFRNQTFFHKKKRFFNYSPFNFLQWMLKNCFFQFAEKKFSSRDKIVNLAPQQVNEYFRFQPQMLVWHICQDGFDGGFLPDFHLLGSQNLWLLIVHQRRLRFESRQLHLSLRQTAQDFFWKLVLANTCTIMLKICALYKCELHYASCVV